MTDQAAQPEPVRRPKPSPLIERLARSDATSSLHVVWGFFTIAAVISAIGVCFMPGADRRISVAMTTPVNIDLPDIPMRAERMESTESMLTRFDKDPQQIENDRLLARVKALEEQLSGITGSIAKQASQQAGSTPQMRSSATPSVSQPPAQVPPMATPQVPPAPAPLAIPAAPPPVQAAPAPPALAPLPATTAPVQTTAAPAPSPISRTSFGLDLAKDTSLGALRAKWEQLRKKHKMLEKLSPQVTIRDANGSVELHLVVGPYINAADAAKTCAALIAAGTPCDGGLYDGQSLPPG
ncbi:hypothetical protein ACFPFW_12200 [Flaviflagellibacter deserti]|uniref:SPOR domain-containing protein n=1 Tax=Flaviflagellibacter deserti TaxID=2267266 RepID=A0ABV9Z7I1_9HYPH